MTSNFQTGLQAAIWCGPTEDGQSRATDVWGISHDTCHGHHRSQHWCNTDFIGCIVLVLKLYIIICFCVYMPVISYRGNTHWNTHQCPLSNSISCCSIFMNLRETVFWPCLITSQIALVTSELCPFIYTIMTDWPFPLSNTNSCELVVILYCLVIISIHQRLPMVCYLFSRSLEQQTNGGWRILGEIKRGRKVSSALPLIKTLWF